MIVAFGHRKRTGKDTAAGLLAEWFAEYHPTIRVAQISFATKLKEIAYDLFKWGGLQPGAFYELPENAHLREVVLPAIGKTPRQIWIEVGNLMREVHPKVWINNALYVDAQVRIVRDLRYFNEANTVEDDEGLRYKMLRDAAPVSNDVADTALDTYDNWSGLIDNNGTLDDLKVKVAEIGEKVMRCLKV